MEKAPILLTIKDIKKMIGVSSDATIYNYMKAGILPFRQIGDNRRFTMEDVNRFLENCKKQSKPTTA